MIRPRREGGQRHTARVLRDVRSCGEVTTALPVVVASAEDRGVGCDDDHARQARKREVRAMGDWNRTGPVVVEVDGSAENRRVVDYASAEALRVGAELVLVAPYSAHGSSSPAMP